MMLNRLTPIDENGIFVQRPRSRAAVGPSFVCSCAVSRATAHGTCWFLITDHDLIHTLIADKVIAAALNKHCH